MSKQLYEEALADVKKIKEIAEDNAKRAVVEAVAPRIRELIEKELLGESSYNEIEKEPEEDELLTDTLPKGNPEGNHEGNPSINQESVISLDELVRESTATENKNDAIAYVSKSIDKLEQLLSLSENSQYSAEELAGLVASLGKMQEIVKENADSLSQKLGYNLKIHNCLKKVEKLQEIKKMKKRMSRLDEAEILLKLTGVPDELEDELDSLGVELVAGEGEEGESAEGEEPEGEEPEGEEAEDSEGGEGEESLDFDLEGGEEPEGEEAEGGEEEVEEMTAHESRRLSDNVIVEIDEGMLRREISRMKALREAKEDVQAWGHGPGDVSSEEDFEADDMGDPLELSLRESDCGPNEDDTNEGAAHEDEKPMGEMSVESLRRRMAHELKLQETLKSRAASAARLYEAAQARFRKSTTLAERKDVSRRGAEHKAAYTNFAKRYNESVKRFNSLSNALAEARARQSARSNNVASKPAASSGASAQLRNKLAETNLLNAKLMFTNKLLQSEALTSRQKSQVIAQLDEAETLREVKLVYESLAKTLAAPRKTVTESRVLGSSSQATRSASPQTLNEGFEAERWAKLAGISK
jgi:hypothetical protein